MLNKTVSRKHQNRLNKGHIPDLVIYSFLHRVYPDIDTNKPTHQLRAIYYNTIKRIQKDREEKGV